MNLNLQRFWQSKWLLSLTAGILLGFSFPPFPFPFLQFPAFVLLFRLMELCTSAREAAYFSYPAFLIWNLIATYWLMMASLVAGIAAILANAVLMALVVMLQYKVQKIFRKGWLVALLQAAFWVSFEYLNHHWDLAWPWLSLGNGWSNATAVIQYISITGFLGVSFWVMLGSALIFQSLRANRTMLRWGTLCFILIFPVFSLIQRSLKSIKGKTTVDVVVAQPNYDSYKPNGGTGSPEDALNIILELSDSVRTPDTKLVLWPESGIFPFLSNRKYVNGTADRINQKLENTAAKWNTAIVGGTEYIEFYSPDHHPALPQWSGKIPFLTYNAAVGFYPDDSTKIYRKHNLVPVVERFPFVHFFNTIDVFGWVDWAAIQQFGKGYEPDQFKVGPTKTPALICYDSVFPSWVREFVQRDAGFLSIITNDGWWGDSSGHKQHFAYARLRAIEFHRWVVRSANNGISGIIAPDGSVKKETTFWARTAFNYSVPVLHDITSYTRFGDWLPFGLMIISLAGLVYMFIKRK